MQEVAQAFEFRDQFLDFGERGAGDALNQRVDVVDRRLVIRTASVPLTAGRRR
jgi:hypothetical protein